jgi:hypothetical protein
VKSIVQNFRKGFKERKTTWRAGHTARVFEMPRFYSLVSGELASLVSFTGKGM